MESSVLTVKATSSVKYSSSELYRVCLIPKGLLDYLIGLGWKYLLVTNTTACDTKENSLITLISGVNVKKNIFLYINNRDQISSNICPSQDFPAKS